MNCQSRLRGVISFLLLLCGSTVQAADTSNVLIVDLYLNQQRMGSTFVLQGADGEFFVAEAVLRRWQINKPWPEPQLFRGENYYNIRRFAGAEAEFRLRTMELHVFLPPALMPIRTVDLRNQGLGARAEEFGVYLDYDLNWLSRESTKEKTAYALFRPVLFGSFGNISANLNYRNHSGGNVFADENSSSGLNVLELTYTRDDPSKLRSLRIGDVFTNPGSQGRSLRIGGIQLATNFETQPTFITYPLPSFYGETAVPSALDIYVNGRLKRREQVLPGRYVLEEIPVINGAGQMQVVARDALGRQQVFTQDFYLSSELLRQGLSEYSFSLGALREKYALENFQYGDLAGSATWRYGLRDNLTVEGRGEFTDGLAMTGGAAQYALKNGGTFNTGLELSAGDSGAGTRWQLGIRQFSSLLNFALEASGTTRNFAVIGNYAALPKVQLLASAGKNFFENGSLGVSVIHQSFHQNPSRTIISANHSKTFRNLLSLSTFISFVDAERSDFTAGIHFSMPFGENHSANGGISTGGSNSRVDAEVRRNLPVGTGYGYHLGVSLSENNYIDAGITAQNEIGTYRLDVQNGDEIGSIWQLGTSGSIAHLSGMTNFAREIRDAFAVVNVGGFEGVRVYAENQEIGRTNEKGRLFVPGLRPYLKNQLRIEIDDLPLNAKVGTIRTETAPYYRSGVVINFDVGVTNNVLLRAVLPDGTPLPEGAVASVVQTDEDFPVGQDGRLYLQGIDRSSQIAIRWNGSSCDIDVPFPDGDSVIAKFGDIVCVPREVR